LEKQIQIIFKSQQFALTNNWVTVGFTNLYLEC